MLSDRIYFLRQKKLLNNPHAHMHSFKRIFFFKAKSAAFFFKKILMQEQCIAMNFVITTKRSDLGI